MSAHKPHKHGICSMTTVVRCPRTGHAWPNSTAKFGLSALAQYLRCRRVGRHRLHRMQAVEQTRRAADHPRTEMSAHKHGICSMTTVVRCPRTGHRSEEHTSQLQSHLTLLCRLLLYTHIHLHIPPSNRHTSTRALPS